MSRWWGYLLHPDEAARWILADSSGLRGGLGSDGGSVGRDDRETTQFLAIAIVALYAIYGPSMGLFRGIFPGLVSGIKLPFLYLFTGIVCFPSLYVFNGAAGPRLSLKACSRLLLLSASANAAALSSYSLVSYLFTLTSFPKNYEFLVMTHVVVFALAGVASVVVVFVVLLTVHRRMGKPLRASFLLAWAVLYALVGTQMAWALRPWIGSWADAYTPVRPIEGSFIQSVWVLFVG